MNGLFWVLIAWNAAVATYAIHTVCGQVLRDRRHPSPTRLMAMRGAYLIVIALMGYSAIMWLDSDGRKFVIVRESFHLACIASSFTAALAIRILRGDRPGD